MQSKYLFVCHLQQTYEGQRRDMNIIWRFLSTSVCLRRPQWHF